MNLSITLDSIIEKRCSLGEGLFLKDNTYFWVDINNNNIYAYKNKNLEIFKTQFKPSIVYDVISNTILLGSDIGLVSFNIKTREETIHNSIFQLHDSSIFRSNDGGSCGNFKILGFMDRKNPEANPGLIYTLINDSFQLIDDNIHIPNSFIEIEPFKLLISDSYKNKIWIYELDKNGNLLNKTLWAELDSKLIPDGGCMIDDYILIALWDSFSIAVFNKNANLIGRLPLPCQKPTNCKFNLATSQLIVTSASENMNKSELQANPNSGYTFIYNLDTCV